MNVNRNAGFAGQRGGPPRNRNAGNGAFRNERMPPRIERGGRHLGVFATGAPVNVAFPGMPQLGVPLHQPAIHVVPHIQGGQLHGVAHHPPMLLFHPGVVNAVVVPHPAVNVAGVVGGAQPRQQRAALPPPVARLQQVGADQQRRAAQPRQQRAALPPPVVRLPPVGADQQRRGARPMHQGAGLPHHAVELLNLGVDQQGRSIREVMLDMMEHLVEVEGHYLRLHTLLMPGDEPALANAVIEPFAFLQIDYNGEPADEDAVQNDRAFLMEAYACFAREEGMLVGFTDAVSEMYARFLFLLDVYINTGNRAN